MARLHVPYHLPVAVGMSRSDCAELAAVVRADHPGDRFDAIFRNYGGRSNTVGVGDRHEILLEVHGPADFDTYNSALMHYRMHTWFDAQMLGHVLLHYHPADGVREGLQVGCHNQPDHCPSREASMEAIWFATELLMPEAEMRDVHARHGAGGLSMFFEAPAQYVRQRAENLGLPIAA